MMPTPLRRTLVCRTLLLAAALLGCDPDAALGGRRYDDEGSVCLSPRGVGGSHVQVLINECESSCADISASCSASLVGDTIVISSQAVATDDPDQPVCRADCQPVSTACTLPDLPDGDYAMRYGARLTSVTLPVPIAGTLALAGVGVDPDTDVCESLPLLP
jgi:hypothetical protein